MRSSGARSSADLQKNGQCDYNVITRSDLSMKAELVRIGNSRGIRIPKPIIEQCGLRDTVELTVEGDRLVVTPKQLLRQGWEEAFRAGGCPASDELLLETLPANKFDSEEWQW
jgi:antitoxin MazE